MIELHERLSEFSYGYGVTRETELLLEQIGIRAVPFLPSLIQEKDLGFDVALNRPGAALMLQFKLGQSLKRFYRKDPALPVPELERPFWRFSINTAEPDGQFETLLKAEQDGAEVYYACPPLLRLAPLRNAVRAAGGARQLRPRSTFRHQGGVGWTRRP